MANGNSRQTVVTSLVYNGVIFLVFIGLFLVLRPRNRGVYESRLTSTTTPEDDKPRPLRSGVFSWITDLLQRRDPEILRETGLDGYFFLRYIRFLFYVFALGIVILLPILLPVNATNGRGKEGLDLLGFGNIQNENRYFAHVFLSWIFFGLMLFFMYRELLFYVAARQAVLTSEAYKHRLSSRTVLVNDVPEKFLDEEYLRSVFSGVKHVFIGRDAKELRKAVENREKLVGKVEGAQNKILNKATKKRLKLERKNKDTSSNELTTYFKKTPTHRLGKIPLPLLSKKVETIPYAKTEVPELSEKIDKLRGEYCENHKLAAAFIVFHTQVQAETASQMLAFHRPLQFSPRTVGVRPEEVVWDNLSLKWWQRMIKSLGASTFCTFLVVFWAIPVAFVGFISQIKVIIELFPWMSWLNNLPPVLLGLISSLLPTILLAVLMMLLPIMIRKAAKISGQPTLTHVEYYTQQVYFAFQVIQVFIVVTLSGSILSSLNDILQDPGQIMNILHSNLPSASNFFINWMLLQSLTIPSGMLLQIVAVLLFHALGYLLDNTPRKKWSRRNLLGGSAWGTTMPVYTNMAVIGLTYSIISPIILPFAAFLFLAVYIAYQNQLTFVLAPSAGGRGIYYARAIQQLFVGIYLAEVILIVLFVFSKSWGPVVLEAVFGLFTIWVQSKLEIAFGPMLYSLPNSLLENGDDTNSFTTASKENPFADATVLSDKDPLDRQELVGYPSTQQSSAGPGKPSIDKQINSLSGQSSLPPPGGFFQRLFKPHIYYTPEILQRDLLTDTFWSRPSEQLDPSDEAKAFNDPATNAGNPEVWFAKDPYGWAEEAEADLRESGINATTSGAWVDITEKKKPNMAFSGDVTEIPIWSPEPPY